MKFSEELFRSNWIGLIPDVDEDFHEEISGFIEFVCSNSLNVDDRLALANLSETSPKILSLLAFDKAHAQNYGDIRLAVAGNISTPKATLNMLSDNADREGWLDYNDWLDYENDDWSDQVDGEFISDFNSDLRDEIRDAVTAAVSKNSNN